MIRWLQGKKTYIGAAAIAVAATVLFFRGQVDTPTFSIALGASVAIAGLSAKLNRYLPDMVMALEDVQQKNYKGAAAIAVGDVAAAAGTQSAPTNASSLRR